MDAQLSLVRTRLRQARSWRVMELNLMVAGFGGQGVITLGKFLAEATC